MKQPPEPANAPGYVGLGILCIGWRQTGKGRYLSDPMYLLCPGYMPYFYWTRTYFHKRWIYTWFEYPTTINNNKVYINYSINLKPYADSNVWKETKGKVDLAAKKGYMWVADCWGYYAWNYGNPPGPTSEGYSHSGKDRLPMGINVLFFDGSAKWINDQNHKLLYAYKWNVWGTESFWLLTQDQLR
ncbi:MAG: hypothetical protein ACK4F0_07145 [Candidatus Ratteibacteria bacterium]